MVTLTSKNEKERNNKLIKYILFEKQTALQAELIGNIDSNILKQLTAYERNKFYSKFEALYKNSFNFHDRMMYAVAWSKLKNNSELPIKN